MRDCEPGALRELLLTAFSSVLAPHSALYAAGPVTTGRAALPPMACGKPVPRAVLDDNRSRLTELVARLRSDYDLPVIDPGLLEPAGWGSTDYDAFYLDVIRRFVREIWFVDGWEFSSGATKEFLLGIALALPLRDEAGRQITAQAGADLIEDALTVARASGTTLRWAPSSLATLRDVC